MTRPARDRRGVGLVSPGGAGWAGLIAGAYARGDLRAAVEAAEVLPASEAARHPAALVAAARAALRVGADDVAIRLAARLPAALGLGGAAIEGFARVRSGDAPGGHAMLTAALGSNHPAERAEAAYRLAFLAWTERKTEGSEEMVRTHLPQAPADQRCHLEQMLGWIEVARERHAQAGRHFARAWQIYREEGLRDEWLRQRILQAVTIVALETIDFELISDDGKLIPHEIGREAREPAFHVAQNLGWLALLDGRELEGFELFMLARALAPSPALVAAAHVNLSAYHRIRGDRSAARDHLSIGQRHLRHQRWSEANADERMTLLEFATEAYRLEPASAAGTVMRYFSTEPRRKRSLAFERDSRVAAIEFSTRALLEAVHGRRTSAAHLLLEAAEAWRSVGYRFREASTLSLLGELSGRLEHVELARRAIEVAPRSWLHREIERHGVSGGGLTALTPAEQRVMRAICAGKSSPEIAADLGRSYHTIRNQTQKVYRAMGVRTRSALVVECVRLGVLPPPQPSKKPG